MTSSYALSSWFFTRALCLIYIIAFLSLANQAQGLWSDRGILPIRAYLHDVEQATASTRYFQLPSVFWITASNAALTGAAALGVVAATVALFGLAQGWMLLLCYVLYLSFCSAGQEFLSFQWDALLLEAGFLALFAVPWSFGWTLMDAEAPHWAVRGLFYLLLFKLMFLSGVVKLQSGDVSWRNMTALSYHYWTQPLPNPLSPFMHALPLWVHRAATFSTFVVELGFPFLIFWPRTRLAAAAGFLLLSLFIFVTGNYTFFNLLTMALCFWLIPDSWWQPLTDKLGWAMHVTAAPAGMPAFTNGVGLALLLLNLFWCCRWFLPDTIETALFPVLRAVQVFHVSNPYGLFAVMTKSRPEIVIEGSLDGNEWREYVFKYKPGPVNRPPPVIAPFQPRLDWQMWFAALGSFRQNPFVQNLMVRLVENSPPVLEFFAANPFPDRPPQLIRARIYDYEFTTPGEILREGVWWKRTYGAEYTPVFERQNAP